MRFIVVVFFLVLLLLFVIVNMLVIDIVIVCNVVSMVFFGKSSATLNVWNVAVVALNVLFLIKCFFVVFSVLIVIFVVFCYLIEFMSFFVLFLCCLNVFKRSIGFSVFFVVAYNFVGDILCRMCRLLLFSV